jgi:hypothetical protein
VTLVPTPPEPEPYSAEAADALVRDLAADLGVELRVAADRVEEDAIVHAVASAEVYPNDPDDPHAVTTTRHGTSASIVCACGRWECIVSGPSSAAWAGRDYRRHVDDEQRGTRDA